jgi:hypothetical protein
MKKKGKPFIPHKVEHLYLARADRPILSEAQSMDEIVVPPKSFYISA